MTNNILKNKYIMAGYEDTKQKIISTLMGRPVGTEIQPENHQDYALNMLDYIRSLELIATSTLIGVTESNTTPVQPNSSRVCYIAGVAQNQTVVFENFIDENGNPISVTTGDMEGVFVILLWNTQYWSAQTFSTNIISQSESATFYYRYNIRKTYESVALMNADVASPIGTDGKYIKVGDIVTVVNSTTPSENGIYSYEGTTDGWKYQSSFNFQLSQSLGSDANVAISQHISTTELKKRVNSCFVATSPLWTVDSNYNVSIDSGQIDLYFGFYFIRLTLTTNINFTIHSGSDLIVYDSSTNEIKRSSSLTYNQFVIGTYYGFNLYINGNVKVVTPNDTIYCNVKHSDLINETMLGIKEYQNFAIVATLRGMVTVDNNVVTIGVGNYYFNTKNGMEYSRSVSTDEQYTISSDGVLVFNLSTMTFSAKSKTAITADECILLFYDAIGGFSKNGLWANVILNNKIESLQTRVSVLENEEGLAKGIVMHVVRGGIATDGTDTIVLSAGNYYFYSQKGIEYNKTLSTDTTFVLSKDWVLVFDLVSKNFIAQIKTATTNEQVVLLLRDVVKGIVPSGVFATDILNNNINSLTTRVTSLETNTSKLPSFVVTEANTTFKRLAQWINGDDTFLIGQITDVHSSGSTKYLHVGYLAELQKVFGFNILWNGGDIGLDTGETLDASYTLLYNTKSQMQSVCPFILTKGNHDYGTQSIPTKTINDIFNVPQKRQFPNMVLLNTGYGYIDDSVLKIRTYIINTSDTPTAGYGMSQTQLQWLADTMATLQANWGVVVLSHLCVDPIGRWTSYPNDASGAYFDTFRSIMAALVAKSFGTNAISGVSWNFTGVPATVKLICNIAGDSHFNNSTLTNGVNYIVRQGYGGISDSEMSIGATKDSFSYVSQCLFDILAIKKNGTSKVFRIGAGGDVRDLSFTY